MAVVALALSVRAGFTAASLPGRGGTLADQTLYYITDDRSLTGSGGSALNVAANATTAIFIPSGKTLTVKGGNSSGKTGAGAGIHLPAGATLVVTGGGKLVATGGQGGNGGNGEKGGDGVVIDNDSDAHDEEGYAGKGGNGGNGGGGAGAGIGGIGGDGATTRAEPSDDWHDTDGDWKEKGIWGWGGNKGGAGGGCGTLYVLGSVTVEPTGGAKGSSGGAQGGGGNLAIGDWTLSYRAGGGGGGGGGGYGNAASNIGGGGGGGGSGGGGGRGGRYRTSRGMIKYSARGGFGGGGSSGGNGKRSDGEKGMHGGNGGDGGSGGDSGDGGAGGKVYKGANATIKNYSSTTAADTHAAITYTITFSDAYRVSQTATAKLGYAPPAAPCPSRDGFTFGGWFSSKNGAGTQFYKADGQPVNSMWETYRDITLYAKWTQDSSFDIRNVTLTVNGVDIVNGADASGTGWSYSGATGKLLISGANGTYDISGRDMDGMAAIEANCNCTIQVSTSLTMDASLRAGRAPVTALSGVTLTFDVKDGATCSLTGGAGATAIRVPSLACLVLKTPGILNVKGGTGAADLGCDADAVNWGAVVVETLTNWAANIRPGHGMEANNGLLNASGHGAVFMNTNSVQLWSVQMSGLGNNATKRLYLQRVNKVLYDDVKADQYGHAWLWLPENGYEWSVEEVATSTNSLWVADVDAHTKAEFFTPLLVTVNGEDAAHLTGPGWQCKRVSGSRSFASLHLRGNGPYVLGGSGNVMVEVWSNMCITASNLMLNVVSWEGASALYLHDKRNLDLTLKGDNSFESAAGCAGIFADDTNRLTIDGDGSLSVFGGTDAAGIGGSAKWSRGGTIIINGGDITANGGPNAAGIGGANTGKPSKPITINRGIVKAMGGENGAGIGGGKGGCAPVTINGGTVFPTPGDRAKAIGAGAGWKGSDLMTNMFDLAAIYTRLDAVSPPPTNANGKAVFPVTFDLKTPNSRIKRLIIGGVTNNVPDDVMTDETGHLTLWLPSSNRTTMTITTDDDSDHSSGYKVDDKGDVEFSTDVVMVDSVPVVGGVNASGNGWSYNGVTSNLVFTTGTHTVSGESTNGTIRLIAAGEDIGLSMSGLMLLTPVSGCSPFVVSNHCTVTVSGENYIACVPSGGKKPKYAAGMEVPAGTSLTIDGDGLLLAMGGDDGAGIGSRGATLPAGSITIAGGYVYAYGGEQAAGIGGGGVGSVESILVTGGYVYARGGKKACGIGYGFGQTSVLSNGVLRVTGGTVLAEKGDDARNDFVYSQNPTSLGGTIKAVLIDGGSVMPKNLNEWPKPVSSNDAELVRVTFTGMVPFDEVTLGDELWPHYNGKTLMADENGTLCLWGPKTNATRLVEIESYNLSGVQVAVDVSAATNSVFSLSGSQGSSPDSRVVETNGVSNICWRVTIPAITASGRLAVTDIDPAFLRGALIPDSAGNASLYLPDGDYDFTVGGLSYHASVTGTPAVATYVVGITVGGTDISAGRGDGWSYDWREGTLKFTQAGEFLVAGTNDDRKVSVCAEASGVKVRADRLILSSSGDAFRLSGDDAKLEYLGGTMEAGAINAPITISGGSIDAMFADGNAVNAAGEHVYRVKVGGLGRFAKANISGLTGYNTENIYANIIGEAYLYLPAGPHIFTLNGRPLAAVVTTDGEAVAHEYTPTGITVNGADVALLAGNGWLNEEGLVSLTNNSNNALYEIAGTNIGSAVSFKVTGRSVTLRLRDVVMTNGMETAAQISLAQNAQGTTKTTKIELVGTNILFGAAAGRSAISLGKNVTLEISGTGCLEAVGGEGASGIGGDTGYYYQKGGTLVVTGVSTNDIDTKGTKISGGSLHLVNSSLASAARNGSMPEKEVYCVTVQTGRPGIAASELFGEDFLGYPLSGATTDADGKLYLWMTNGTYYTRLDDIPCRAVVAGEGTEFAPWSMGVEVDGVDVSYGAGTGWTYDVYDGLLHVFGDCAISGSNAVGSVSVVFTNDVSVIASNLTLSTDATFGKSPMSVLSGAHVSLNLVGENRLSSMASGYAGINVRSGAGLAIYGGKKGFDDALSVMGGANAAGIGGNPGEGYGRIEIFSGAVTTMGGEEGAGIGSGSFSGGQQVNFNQIGEIAVSGDAEVVATGGQYGAGIGGGCNHRGGNVSITNGTVTATGGLGAAGIGGGYQALPMRISILGGTVVAKAGETTFLNPSSASDIGEGEQSTAGNGLLPPLTIKRASVHAMSGRLVPAPSNGTERVYCVTVDVGQPDETPELLDLPDYEGVEDIHADAAGKLYLWLPNGTNVFFCSGIPLIAVVAGADTGAQEDFTGVMVDGVDAAYGEGKGRKWQYNRVTKKLTVIGDCVVAGTNTEGKVSMVADAAADVTFSNLLLVADSPITANADLSLLGRGVNEVGSPASVVAGTGMVTFACGTFRMDGSVASKANIVGGSLHLPHNGAFAFAPSNGTAQVYCVTLTNLTVGAKVTIGGLPDYYDTRFIYSDAEGKAYLWLPVDWGIGEPQTGTAVTNTFNVNGHAYTVIMRRDGSSTVEENGVLEVEGFLIKGFSVKDGILTINVSSTPGTWISSFPAEVRVRVSDTLPIPRTPETAVDLSAAAKTLEDDGSMTYSVSLPPSNSPSRFFMIEKK